MADSFSVDFHKLFWQPISCAVFLLKDARQFRFLEMHTDYLNPESHERQGVPDLVSRSLATTRRFDALKLWISLQTLGREKLGAMIDRTFELAQHAARRIREARCLGLVHEPQLGCVVFRYLPEKREVDADRVNPEIRRRLLQEGSAVIGHTRVHGHACLKLTILNPCVTEAQITALLEDVQNAGRQIELE
jgi:L-2,4-diaminobutyrate decarboxylase